MKRPRLTAKVLRGLIDVEDHATADLEVMSTEEGRDPKQMEDMKTALQYLRDLARWDRARKHSKEGA